MIKFLSVLMLAIPLSASAGVFAIVSTSGWDTKKSIKYKVEAKGFDFRVYEWQLESNGKTCVLVSTEDNQFFQCDK